MTSERADLPNPQVRTQGVADSAKMTYLLSPSCAALEHAGLTSEAATIAQLIAEDHHKTAYFSTFTEDRDVVTLVHGDFWSDNMMFRVRNCHQAPTGIVTDRDAPSNFGLAGFAWYSSIDPHHHDSLRHVPAVHD